MNDICNVSDIFFTIMYADDTSLLVNGNDLHSLVASLNNALKDYVLGLNLISFL